MKLTKFLTACTAALFLVGCSDKNDPNLPEPTPGADVLFGAALDAEPQTRTIYGPEANNKFPILWLNGDQVKVMSPECYIKEGTYAVNLSTDADGHEAGTLVKQGDAGVQWGDKSTANFFSVYPAQHVTEMNPANRTVKCHLIHNQNDYIHYDGTKYTALADMKAGFLTAATYNAPNDQNVNLLYKPIATALRFTLQGPGAQSQTSEVTVSHVRITAPADQVIAGDFTLTFPETEDGNITITPAASVDNSTGYNYITVFSSYEGNEGGAFLTLGKGESIELNAFLLISAETEITSDWTLEVLLSDGTTLTKKLGGTTTGTQTTKLTPGQIHRLPALPAIDVVQGDYDPSNWMVNIPRNTYLSEISIPGSWNSMGDAQKIGTATTATSLTDQYKAGARAFHLDTRWKANGAPRSIAGALPTFSTRQLSTNLGVCDGSSGYNTLSGLSNQGRMLVQTATNFSDALATITGEVKADEYMIVMCTFAQDSYNPSSQPWINAISTACANNADVYDSSTISPTTTVGEVLGKVIVMVCLEGAVDTYTLPTNSKCMYVNAPLTLTESMFTGATGTNDVYQSDLLYNSKAQVASSGITLFNTQAQICRQSSSSSSDSDRGYAPTLDERQLVGSNILNKSMINYADKDNYVTNTWYYFGLGGYYGSNNYTGVATSMNTWINDKVNNMSSRPTGNQTTYYPLGIVLMNQVANHTDVMNNILQLNNKFQKEFDDSKPAFPDKGGNKAPLRGDYSGTHTYAGNAWIINKP